MPDPIYKLQAHRTIHLQGFSDFGAAGAIHHASATGFTASGVFRDAADFCVIRLWDRDDFFGHPRFSYPPDHDVNGIVLTFDRAYENLQRMTRHPEIGPSLLPAPRRPQQARSPPITTRRHPELPWNQPTPIPTSRFRFSPLHPHTDAHHESEIANPAALQNEPRGRGNYKTNPGAAAFNSQNYKAIIP